MKQLFFVPDIENDISFLNPEESRHCLKVLRFKKGDLLTVTNGKGIMATGTIVDSNSDQCAIKISDRQVIPRHYSEVHIAIAPTKNTDRLEWFAEKATEIGVDVISPVFCKHSERTTFKIQRIEKVVIAAAKQSLKSWFPLVNEPLRFNDFIKLPLKGQKFIAYCETGAEAMLHTYLCDLSPKTILIGPEGDFSPEEVALAQKSGFIPVSLGTARLRTETAGVVACHMVRVVESLNEK